MYGKLLGAIIGAMVGLAVDGWIVTMLFALVGAYIGNRLDQLHAPPDELEATLPQPPSSADLHAQARAHFARHVCALFADVARADGDVVRDEVRVVRAFFQQDLRFSPEELEFVRVSLKDALANPSDLGRAIDECRAELGPSERLLLLDALYELALVDGGLHRLEGEAIKRISSALGIPDSDRRAIAAIHLGTHASAYDVLGVPPEIPDDELRRTYRRLAAEHHPDRVSHLGEGAVEVATRRFREINEAWEQVRKLRGL